MGFQYVLFNVLEGIETFFTGSYFDDVLYVVDEDLTVTDVACIKNLLSCIDNSLYRNSRDYDIHLDLREQ